MTLVPHSSREEASSRAERIRRGLEAYAVLREDIATAYLARDWTALGYQTWHHYVESEFTSAARLSLPREERRELVTYFREQGMSTRAIASATGAARNTVLSDLGQVAQTEPPAPSNVVGIDGKTYDRIPRPAAGLNPSPALAYPASETSVQTPRRRPLTDVADDTGWEIRKAAEKVMRVLADDRYPKNEEQVSLAMRGHLLFAAETVAVALEKLGN